MNIAEAMEAIAKEAERQGFQVRQVRSGMWQFRLGSDNWFVSPRTVEDLLQYLAVLIAAGLDWSRWDIPDQYDRDA
jgi:hypothetical protein